MRKPKGHTVKTIRSIKSKSNAVALFAALLLATVLGSTARAADPVGDATAIVTSATTVFNAVATLVVAMVGFFVIIRIVKGVRK